MRECNKEFDNNTFFQSRASGSKLIDLINKNSLQQHINESTRLDKRISYIGLVMNTLKLRIIGLEATSTFGDHQMIDFALKLHDPNTRTQQKHVLDNKRANFERMKKELGSINCEMLIRIKKPEECYMILKEKLATATAYHILKKSGSFFMWKSKCGVKAATHETLQELSMTRPKNIHSMRQSNLH
ncbi:hypothetical protein FHG87_003705 [Trinorchestia longiramus]|nr:hypothetical protein FHG87_003705 [Trinorchestia longiramus]